MPLPDARITMGSGGDERAQTMETTLKTGVGVKRRRSAFKSEFRSDQHSEERRRQRQLGAGGIGVLTGAFFTRKKMPATFLGLSLRSCEPFSRDSLVMTTRPLKRRAPCGPSYSTQSRRCRSYSTVVAWCRVAVALACVASLSSDVPLSTAAAVAASAEDDFLAVHSTRLCAPADDARAYVTTLAGEARGQVLGPRVLAQSLRSAGAKGDIIVLVPVDKATGTNVDALRRDGLTVHIVPRGLQTG